MTYYNRTNTCDKVKEDGNLCGNKFHGKALREKNKDGNWTGNWICNKCYMDSYHKKTDRKKESRERYLSDRRTGNLNPVSTQIKGDRSEELTCRFFGVENLNIKNDNYEFPIDHSEHPEFGILQTKSKWYDPFWKRWSTPLIREHNKEFDYLVLYCISENGKIIERIYIIPKEEVIKRSSVAIYKYQNNPRCHYWYETYRIKDENVIIKINEIWREIND